MISTEQLKEDLLDYFEEYHTPKRILCEYCGFSAGYLYKWLRDEVRMSVELQSRIDDFLDERYKNRR